jgi:hypothetical protein
VRLRLTLVARTVPEYPENSGSAGRWIALVEAWAPTPSGALVLVASEALPTAYPHKAAAEDAAYTERDYLARTPAAFAARFLDLAVR